MDGFEWLKVLFGGGRQYFIRNRQQDPQYGDAYISFQRQDDLDLIEVRFLHACTLKSYFLLFATFSINILHNKWSIRQLKQC